MAIVTSQITDHRSDDKYNDNENICDTEKLLKCDPETQNEQMLLENWR